MRLFLVAVVVSQLAGCAWKQVLVNTNPQGANVYVEGALVGQSPVLLSDPGGMGKQFLVQAKMAGRQEATVLLRQEWGTACTFDAVAGVLVWPLWFGFLGCSVIPENYVTLELRPSEVPPRAQ